MVEGLVRWQPKRFEDYNRNACGGWKVSRNMPLLAELGNYNFAPVATTMPPLTGLAPEITSRGGNV
jgi:hypothetical protein